jgi:hypothetical protein
MIRRLVPAIILIAASLLVCGTGISGALASDRNTRKAHAASRVYMLTGMLGITSGLDSLAAQVQQQSGLPTRMAAPGGWPSLASEAITGYKSGSARSIIIVGYSAGGGAAIDMARELDAANVPVALLIVIDGVGRSAVPPNVRKLVNYYVAGGISSAIARPPGQRGTLHNIAVSDAGIGHFTLIAAKQAELFREVVQASRSAPVQPATQPPSSASAAVTTSTRQQ